MISIIIRTCNEERWITHCLKAVFNQTNKDIEVIIVDNCSTDRTLDRTKQFPVKILNINNFSPGKAINYGIRASKGEYLVCVSAHCIPANDIWLEMLLRNFKDHSVAGVYGRQIPMKSSTDSDKRDMLITFGLDKKVQVKDSFFHNANSVFPRKIWDNFPFDEQATNIEDRIWGKSVIDSGYKIIYEPEAAVYHEHGIHQDGNPERCRNVMCIMDSLDLHPENDLCPFTAEDLNILALIPLQGPMLKLPDGTPILDITFENTRASHLISKCVVLTDNDDVKTYSEAQGYQSLLRPPSLSEENVSLEEVFQFGLKTLEQGGEFPDLVVTLEPTFPFRPPFLLDSMINTLLAKGVDSVLAGFPEYRACWIETTNDYKRIDEGFMRRKFKHPIQIGLIGLGCVTYPDFIREGHRLGKKIGIYEIEDKLAPIEIRKKEHIQLGEHILEYYRRSNAKNPKRVKLKRKSSKKKTTE